MTALKSLKEGAIDDGGGRGIFLDRGGGFLKTSARGFGWLGWWLCTCVAVSCRSIGAAWAADICCRRRREIEESRQIEVAGEGETQRERKR